MRKIFSSFNADSSTNILLESLPNAFLVYTKLVNFLKIYFAFIYYHGLFKPSIINLGNRVRWRYNLIFPVQLIYYSNIIYWIILPSFNDIWVLACIFSISNLSILLQIYFQQHTLLIILVFYYFLISKSEKNNITRYSHLVTFSKEIENCFVGVALRLLRQGAGNVGTTNGLPHFSWANSTALLCERKQK